MKVLLINGSPHQTGSTNEAVWEVGKALEDEEIDTGAFWSGNHPLAGCIGCGFCVKAGRCCYGDRVNMFLETAKDYDGFVFGTPVHFAPAAASMLGFLSRAFFTDRCTG